MTFRNGLGSLLRPEDSVLLLIDHQPYQLANVNSHDPQAVVNNTVALAKMAQAFKVPTILTSVLAARGGLLFKPLTDLFPGQQVINRSWINKIGYLLARSAFRALREKLDPRRSNGGGFLGLNGVVIKSHGGTDAEGFASAVDIGYDMVRYQLLSRIEANISERPRASGGDAPAAAESVSSDDLQVQS